MIVSEKFHKEVKVNACLWFVYIEIDATEHCKDKGRCFSCPGL